MINEINTNNTIETLLSVFTIEKGILKVLLFRKKTEPYKNYWVLPGDNLKNNETIEDNVMHVADNKVGFTDLHIEQTHVYSELNRTLDSRLIAINFLGLVDSKSVEIKREVRSSYESEWFSLDAVPKMAFDHNLIVTDATDYLRKKIVNSNVLKSMYPSDFTLPEIQSVYEKILNKILDRRNFRKKFINLGLIEYTGEKTEGLNGRPAKLYRFKNDIKVRDLF